MAYKNNQNKGKKRKDKINLVFDEAKRRDFLKGFHKRKLQRKKKAQDELQEKLKEEKRRIKQESKESYKKLVVSYRPIPELDDLMKEEYEDDDVTVKIVELSADDIAKKSNWIGQNVPKEEKKETKEESTDEDDDSPDELPGMELKRKPVKKQVDDVEEKQEEIKTFKTKKDITKHIKNQATKHVQKSKAFQMKYKQDQMKNKKKSMQLKHRREKFLSKKSKMRHRGKHKGNAQKH